MTSLKCLNSGVELNGAAFILSPSGHEVAFRVLGASGEEVVSPILQILAGKFLVGDPTSHNLFHDGGKTLRVSGLPVVIAESLFVKVAKQVERFNANVGAVQAPLQETPEVLHGVRVDVPVHILDGVVNHGVLVAITQAIVGKQFIAEDCGTRLYAITNRALQFFFLRVST